MRYRVLKFFTTSANLMFLWLVMRLFTGHHGADFVGGCLAVSAFWLGFTFLRLHRLFQTYVSLLSRLQIFTPLTFGLVLDLVALFHSQNTLLSGFGAAEIMGWLFLALRWRVCAKKYEREGHGPLPKDTWINPQGLLPGDIILTNGHMADVAHDAVGHGELVLRDETGKTICFSAYMGEGIVFNPIERVEKGNMKTGFYIAVRPVVPLSDEELCKALQIARSMGAENAKWREETNARRQAFIGKLPLNVAAKAWLTKRLHVDGYDWRGLVVGVPSKHAWTCIAAVLTCYRRLGRKMLPYGTGMFGLGTGILDPIVPVRFVYDPNFRLLTLKDKQEWEEKQGGREDQ